MERGWTAGALVDVGTFECGICGLAGHTCSGKGTGVQADEQSGELTGRLTGGYGNTQTGGRTAKRAYGVTTSGKVVMRTCVRMVGRSLRRTVGGLTVGRWIDRYR